MELCTLLAVSLALSVDNNYGSPRVYITYLATHVEILQFRYIFHAFRYLADEICGKAAPRASTRLGAKVLGHSRSRREPRAASNNRQHATQPSSSLTNCCQKWCSISAGKPLKRLQCLQAVKVQLVRRAGVLVRKGASV